MEDRVAVVTGGGTGNGLMIAQAFANNGARVYITGRRREVLDQAVKTWGSSLAHSKGQLIPIECDITNKDSIKSLVEEIQKREKQVDVLVNNAGIRKDKSDVGKGQSDVKEYARELFSEEQSDWEETYRTNVVGYATALPGFKLG
jgi:NAD(P)-dependent dehydrogenase (short-subunit alcohol dehydrogenase family)